MSSYRSSDWEVVGCGPTNTLLDVGNLKVGHYHRSDEPYLTGCTVTIFDAPARAAVEVGGFAPGTRETDALAPNALVEQIDAVLFTGSSAYGLDAAGGVMKFLQLQGKGFRVGVQDDAVVPIVPTATIFDLGRGGSFVAHCDFDFGVRACETASSEVVALGRVGAGRGAMSGGVKGGVGSASATLANGAMVGAICVVNSRGSVFRRDSTLLYAKDLEMDEEFQRYTTSESTFDADRRSSGSSAFNTTVALLCTDVDLSRSELKNMARIAHDGLARAIRPIHTYFDGDTVFAASVGGRSFGLDEADRVHRLEALSQLFEVASDTLSRAIVHGVLSANSG